MLHKKLLLLSYETTCVAISIALAIASIPGRTSSRVSSSLLANIAIGAPVIVSSEIKLSMQSESIIYVMCMQMKLCRYDAACILFHTDRILLERPADLND